MLGQLLKKVASKNSRELRVLDIGSGSGSIWLQPDLRGVVNELALKVTLFDAADELDLVDLPGNFTHRNGYAPSDLKTFDENEFDVVIAFDLIEHLSKDQGYLLLYEMDRLASLASVVFTPNGFLWQPPAVNNPFNAHISGWTPSELAKMGWKSTGLFGFKFLMGPYAAPRFEAKTGLGKVALQYIMAASQLLARRVPFLAFSFFGVKTEKNAFIERQV